MTAEVRFHSLVAPRVARIESAWSELKKGSQSDGLSAELEALQGEARELGYADVLALCVRLEDLFEMAGHVGHIVDEEFDLVVGMALRFIELTSRARAGMPLGGVDLPGFFRQIDQVLRTTSQGFGGRTRTGTPISIPPRKLDETVSPTLRMTLASPAADAFIEYAAAKGHRRNRLRAAWHVLRSVVAIDPAPRVRGQVLRVAGVPFPVMLEGWTPAGSPGDRRPLEIALLLGLSGEAAAGTTRTFTKGSQEIAVVLSGPPYEAEGTRVVITDGLYEVVLIENKEALLFRPELTRTA